MKHIIYWVVACLSIAAERFGSLNFGGRTAAERLTTLALLLGVPALLIGGYQLLNGGEDIRERSDHEKVVRMCDQAAATIATQMVLINKYGVFSYKENSTSADAPPVSSEMRGYNVAFGCSNDKPTISGAVRLSVEVEFADRVSRRSDATCTYRIQGFPGINEEDSHVRLRQVEFSGKVYDGSDIFDPGGISIPAYEALPPEVRPDRECGHFSRGACFQQEYSRRNECSKPKPKLSQD